MKKNEESTKTKTHKTEITQCEMEMVVAGLLKDLSFFLDVSIDNLGIWQLKKSSTNDVIY